MLYESVAIGIAVHYCLMHNYKYKCVCKYIYKCIFFCHQMLVIVLTDAGDMFVLSSCVIGHIHPSNIDVFIVIHNHLNNPNI